MHPNPTTRRTDKGNAARWLGERTPGRDAQTFTADTEVNTMAALRVPHVQSANDPIPGTPRPRPLSALQVVVGLAAIAAPALHSFTDAMEWYQQGFSTLQLWLNYIAFVPMPWLLLGGYVIRAPRTSLAGLAGALLYGTAFTYFAYTTLYALAEKVPTYEALWARLGNVYTFHGALMVFGGLLFAGSALRGAWLPKSAAVLFLSGILINLLLSFLPAPDILQTVGSSVRNLGLMAMGYDILLRTSSHRNVTHAL